MGKPYFGSRLFLSCDLVGSTNYKQEKSATDEDWYLPFATFYQEFPEITRKYVPPEVNARVWKAAGDELIFIADVTSEAQVHDVVQAWLTCLTDFQESLDLVAPKMAVKGAAFMATFPAPDREIEIGESAPDVSPVLDFLGPSIDTGFRIFGTSSERYFTMTVEVAWAYAEHLLHIHHQDEDLRFLGVRSLKGVWGGRDYPLMAIDRQPREKVNKSLDKINGVRHVSPSRVAKLAAACSKDGDWPSCLYLPDAKSRALRRKKVREKMAKAQLQTSGNSDVGSIPEGAPMTSVPVA